MACGGAPARSHCGSGGLKNKILHLKPSPAQQVYKKRKERDSRLFELLLDPLYFILMLTRPENSLGVTFQRISEMGSVGVSEPSHHHWAIRNKRRWAFVPVGGQPGWDRRQHRCFDRSRRVAYLDRREKPTRVG
jgi:hypothetical protein